MPDKLKQRELWMTVGGMPAAALAPKLGLTEEQVYTIGAMAVGYALSRGHHKAAQAKAGG